MGGEGDADEQIGGDGECVADEEASVAVLQSVLLTAMSGSFCQCSCRIFTLGWMTGLGGSAGAVATPHRSTVRVLKLEQVPTVHVAAALILHCFGFCRHPRLCLIVQQHAAIDVAMPLQFGIAPESICCGS